MRSLKEQCHKALSSLARRFGCKLSRIHPPASEHAPVGDAPGFLDSLRARGLQCRGVIDVGANAGGFTRVALGVFPEAKYLLIEPQSEMTPHFEALRQQFPGVEYVIAGAGSQAGELVQTIFENTTGSTFLVPPDETLLRAGKQRKVPIMTLDGLLAGRNLEPTIVKIDAQGFELEVLRGAASCFGTTEVFIVQVATMPFQAKRPALLEVMTFMSDRDYAFYDISWIMRRPCDGALGLLDIAFVKANGALRNSPAWGKG